MFAGLRYFLASLRRIINKKLPNKIAGQFQSQKSNIFMIFDLNSNKVTYTPPRLIIYIFNESIYL